MIRVAHLITGLNAGGAEQMLARLVTASSKARFHHTVVSMMDEGPIGADLTRQGIDVRALQMPRGLAQPLGLLKGVRVLRDLRPDVLQTWMYHADLLGALAAPLAGIKHLCWNVRCSNMDLADYSALARTTRAVCVRLSFRPRVVVVNSEAGRAFHEALGYRPKRWAVIRNGIDLGRFIPDPRARQDVRESLGIAPKSVLVGLVARVDPMKDHDNFIAAAGLLARTADSARFLLVGHGADPENGELMASIARHGLQDRIQLLGRRPDVHRILNALDIACLSSRYGEGFPNVVAEAMACGVPCVVTDVGDAASIVGTCGVVVPPRDSAALAAGLASLIRLGEDGRRRLGDAARERITQHFGLAQTVAQYEDLYSGICEPQQGGRP